MLDMSSNTLGLVLGFGAADFQGELPLGWVAFGLPFSQGDLDRTGGFDGLLEAGDVHLFAEDLRELLDLGQLTQVLEAEVEQEFLRGPVEHGSAHDFLPSGDADEALL